MVNLEKTACEFYMHLGNYPPLLAEDRQLVNLLFLQHLNGLVARSVLVYGDGGLQREGSDWLVPPPLTLRGDHRLHKALLEHPAVINKLGARVEQ